MEELCRLCGNANGEMIPLAKSRDLIDKIFECTTILVRNL